MKHCFCFYFFVLFSFVVGGGGGGGVCFFVFPLHRVQLGIDLEETCRQLTKSLMASWTVKHPIIPNEWLNNNNNVNNKKKKKNNKNNNNNKSK